MAYLRWRNEPIGLGSGNGYRSGLQHDVHNRMEEETYEMSTRMKKVMRNWQLYVFLFPTLAYFILFQYVPLYGLQIAFKDFMAMKGIWGSDWVGLKHFD